MTLMTLSQKGQDAVRRVLYDSPGEWFTVTRMATELRRRGWIGDDPEAGGAVRAAIARAEKSDELIFKGKGAKTGAITYSYRPFAHGSFEVGPVGHKTGPTLRDALWKAHEDGART